MKQDITQNPLRYIAAKKIAATLGLSVAGVISALQGTSETMGIGTRAQERLLNIIADQVGEAIREGLSQSKCENTTQQGTTRGSMFVSNQNMTESNFKFKPHRILGNYRRDKNARKIKTIDQTSPTITLDAANNITTKFIESNGHKQRWFWWESTVDGNLANHPTLSNFQTRVVDNNGTLIGTLDNTISPYEQQTIPNIEYVKTVYEFTNSNTQPAHLWIYDVIATNHDPKYYSNDKFLEEMLQHFRVETRERYLSDTGNTESFNLGSLDNPIVQSKHMGAFWNAWSIANTTHIILQPGQNHKHTTYFRCNAVLDKVNLRSQLQEIEGRDDINPAAGFDTVIRTIAGKTHGCLIRTQGTLGYIRNNGAEGLDDFPALTGTRLSAMKTTTMVYSFINKKHHTMLVDLDNGIYELQDGLGNEIDIERNDVRVYATEDAVQEDGQL